MEGSIYGLIQVLFWYLPGKTEEHHEKSLRIAGISAEIRAKLLPDTSSE
jgi:hypothetical protein